MCSMTRLRRRKTASWTMTLMISMVQLRCMITQGGCINASRVSSRARRLSQRQHGSRRNCCAAICYARCQRSGSPTLEADV